MSWTASGQVIPFLGVSPGGVVLARAVQDPQFSDEILVSVRQKLS